MAILAGALLLSVGIWAFLYVGSPTASSTVSKTTAAATGELSLGLQTPESTTSSRGSASAPRGEGRSSQDLVGTLYRILLSSKGSGAAIPDFSIEHYQPASIRPKSFSAAQAQELFNDLVAHGSRTGRILIKADAHAPLELQAQAMLENWQESPDGVLRIELDEALSIGGAVRFSNGEPVVGTKVYIVGPKSGWGPRSNRRFAQPLARVLTDSDGRFRVAWPGGQERIDLLVAGAGAYMPSLSLQIGRSGNDDLNLTAYRAFAAEARVLGLPADFMLPGPGEGTNLVSGPCIGWRFDESVFRSLPAAHADLFFDAEAVTPDSLGQPMARTAIINAKLDAAGAAVPTSSSAYPLVAEFSYPGAVAARSECLIRLGDRAPQPLQITASVEGPAPGKLRLRIPVPEGIELPTDGGGDLFIELLRPDGSTGFSGIGLLDAQGWMTFAGIQSGEYSAFGRSFSFSGLPSPIGTIRILPGEITAVEWAQAPFAWLQMDFAQDPEAALGRVGPGVTLHIAGKSDSMVPGEAILSTMQAPDRSGGAQSVLLAPAGWAYEVRCEPPVFWELRSQTVPLQGVVPQVPAFELTLAAPGQVGRLVLARP